MEHWRQSVKRCKVFSHSKRAKFKRRSRERNRYGGARQKHCVRHKCQDFSTCGAVRTRGGWPPCLAYPRANLGLTPLILASGATSLERTSRSVKQCNAAWRREL